MIRKFLIFSVLFHSYFNSTSQPVTLPKLISYKDTAKNYYLTFCEEYLAMFEHHYSYLNLRMDSCLIDFSKYDLQGIKVNGVIKWEIISPKKYCNLLYEYMPEYDTIDWKVFPRDLIINDSNEFNMIKKNARRNLIDSFDFSKTALIYNNVWVDCRGYFYYKIEYDQIKNTLICNLIEIYGGSRGMCPKDSWIKITKPKPDTKIVMRDFWVN